MKMKTYIAPFMALMMIGLLVITGCQGFFEPPVSVADGKGILQVSINSADGRTILPAARLDKYVLTIDSGEPIELQGSKSFELAAGTYSLNVKGYIGETLVAEATQSATVIAGKAESVTITLNPSDTTGTGTFTWDFSILAEDEDGEPIGGTVAIEIYDIEDTGATPTDLYDDDADYTGSVTLPVGVYNVKFTVSDEDDVVLATWWEILYIYAGLTSAYDHTYLGIQEIVPTIPYVLPVPADGTGFFYLDLNNWKTQSPDALGEGMDIVPYAVTSTTDLTVNFKPIAGNQRINIGLTAAQTALLNASAGPFTVIIEGSVTGGTDGAEGFRYFLGDAEKGGQWNATSGSGNATFAGLLGDANKKSLAWDGNHGAPNNTDPKHLILHRRIAGDVDIKITSIKIEYPIYTVPAYTPTDPETEGGFYLNLNNWDHVATAVNTTPVDFVDITANALTVGFTVYEQRLNIALSAAQIAALNGADASIKITIWGEADAATAQFRYHLGDPDAGSAWGATDAVGPNAFEDLADPDDGVEKTATMGDRGNLKYFILQYRDNPGVATEVTISKILVEYTITPPAVCECTDCAMEGKTIAEAKTAWLFCTCEDHPAAPCDDCEVCTAVGPIPFDMSTVQGIKLSVGGSGAVLSAIDTDDDGEADDWMVTVTGGGSTIFFVSYADAGYTYDAADDITITYAAIVWPGELAPVIVKKDSSWNNIATAMYPRLVTSVDNDGDYEAKTLVIPAGHGADTLLGFQHNNGDGPGHKYQIKIISVTGAHE